MPTVDDVIARAVRISLAHRWRGVARALTIGVLSLLSSGVSTASFAAVPLSDADARKMLQDEHAANSVFKLQVGKLAIVRKDAPYAGADAISERRFNELRAWSHVGLVDIKADQDWVSFEQGRGDRELYNQKKEGVVQRIVVEATPKAREFRDRKIASQYDIPMGRLVVERIEQNIARAFGSDEYRVITFAGRFEFLPVTEAYFTQFFARKPKTDARAIFLMKHEPSTKSWTRVAADWADDQGSFRSSNVQQKLLELSKK